MTSPTQHDQIGRTHELEIALAQSQERVRTLTKFVSQLKTFFTCTICMDWLMVPVTCSCSHTFCFQCLYTWLNRQRENGIDVEESQIKKAHVHPQCPMCRQIMYSKPVRSLPLAQQVEFYFHSVKNAMPVEGGCEDVEVDAVEKNGENWQPNENEVVSESQKNMNNKISEMRADAFNQKVQDALAYYNLQTFEAQVDPWEIIFPDKAKVDTEDGVRRCPYCIWEIVGHECAKCGWTFSDAEEGDVVDEGDDLTDEYSDEEEQDDYLATDEDELDEGVIIADADEEREDVGYSSNEEDSIEEMSARVSDRKPTVRKTLTRRSRFFDEEASCDSAEEEEDLVRKRPKRKAVLSSDEEDLNHHSEEEDLLNDHTEEEEVNNNSEDDSVGESERSDSNEEVSCSQKTAIGSDFDRQDSLKENEQADSDSSWTSDDDVKKSLTASPPKRDVLQSMTQNLA